MLVKITYHDLIRDTYLVDYFDKEVYYNCLNKHKCNDVYIHGDVISKEKTMWINPTVIQKVTYVDYTQKATIPANVPIRAVRNELESMIGKVAVLELTKDRVIAIKVNSEDDIPKLLEQLGLKVRAVKLD